MNPALGGGARGRVFHPHSAETNVIYEIINSDGDWQQRTWHGMNYRSTCNPTITVYNNNMGWWWIINCCNNVLVVVYRVWYYTQEVTTLVFGKLMLLSKSAMPPQDGLLYNTLYKKHQYEFRVSIDSKKSRFPMDRTPH